MFHAIEKFRLPAQILLGAIAVSFVGFGLAGFETSNDKNYIVRVGDEVITRDQLETALRNTEASGNPANRETVFKTLLDQAYLIEGAKKLGITISDEQIKQSIVDNPLFHDANQKFDPALFQNLLQNNGIGEADFMNQERRRLTIMSLLSSLNQNIVADAPAKMLINSQLAPRQMRSVPIAPESFADKVAIDETALQKYYEANKAQYLLPQAVKYEYVVLSSKSLADKETASEEEIKQAFEAQQKTAQTKRRLAHILFAAPSSADEATRAAAKAQAQKIATQLAAQPEQFAQLARQYSQDEGSKNQGGDLGEFSQNGALGSKSLEDAAFSLKEGQISGVVESDFGYHIVRATQVQSDNFEHQKAALAQQVKEKKAQAAYNKLRDALSDAVFADSGSLKTAADKLGVTLHTQSTWQTQAALANEEKTLPKNVADVLFSQEMLNKKQNSDPIHVNGETWFVRVTEVRPESTQAFADVKQQVHTAYVQTESMRLAKEYGDKILADLRAGKTVQLAWSPIQTAWPQQLRSILPPEAYQQWMQTVPKHGKPAYALLNTVPAPQLIEVVAIEPLADDKQVVQQARLISAQNNGNLLVEALIDDLQKSIKTKQGNQTIND